MIGAAYKNNFEYKKTHHFSIAYEQESGLDDEEQNKGAIRKEQCVMKALKYSPSLSSFQVNDGTARSSHKLINTKITFFFPDGSAWDYRVEQKQSKSELISLRTLNGVDKVY